VLMSLSRHGSQPISACGLWPMPSLGPPNLVTLSLVRESNKIATIPRWYHRCRNQGGPDSFWCHSDMSFKDELTRRSQPVSATSSASFSSGFFH
jgi:hypothetical protein